MELAVGEHNHLSRTMHLLKSIIRCFIILSIHLGFEMLIIHGLLLLFVTPLKFITNYTKIVNTCAFLHTYVSKINMSLLKYLKKYYNDLSSSTNPLLLRFPFNGIFFMGLQYEKNIWSPLIYPCSWEKDSSSSQF